MLFRSSWETDDEQLVPKAELPGLLARLAAASPAADTDSTNHNPVKRPAPPNSLSTHCRAYGCQPSAADR